MIHSYLQSFVHNALSMIGLQCSFSYNVFPTMFFMDEARLEYATTRWCHYTTSMMRTKKRSLLVVMV